MKKFLLLFFASFIITSISAQQSYLSGTVKEETNNTPISFCSVALLQQDSVTAFALTDDKGYFEIPLSPGNYKMVTQFMGYQTDTTAIQMGNVNKRLGNIYLQENSVDLDEVVVEASTKANSLEKDEIIVTKKLRTGASTASDVLGKLDGVTLDRYNKTIKVDNQKNVLLLVNGLQKSEKYIKSLNPERISKVEITRDPSGRYGLAGYSAVINVILKKNYVGQELFVENTTIIDPKTKDKAHLVPIQEAFLDYTYSRKSLNLYTEAWLDITNLKLDQKLERSHNNGLEVKQSTPNQDPNMLLYSPDIGGLVGADYQFSDKHTLSFEGYVDASPNDKNNIDYLITNTEDNGSSSQQMFSSRDKKNSIDYAGSLFYIGNYKNNRKLDASFTYGDDISEATTHFSLDNNPTTNINKGNTSFLRSNIEWTQPLSDKVTYQVGYGNTWNKKQNEFSTNESSTVDKFKQTDLRNNVFAYGSWKINKKLSLKTGLAVENSIQKSDHQEGNFWIYQPHFDLFYKPLDWLNFKLRYRTNANYPSLSQLNPVETVIDNYAIQKGNPELAPSTRHRYSFRANVLQGLMFAEVFYQHSDDYIGSVGNLNTDNIIEYTFDNLGGFQRKGVRFNLTIPFGDKLFWSNYATIYQSELSYLNKTNSVNDWYGESQLFYVDEKHGLVAGVMLQKSNAREISPQGYSQNDSDFWATMVQKSFFDDKLNVMLLYMLPIDWVTDYNQVTYFETPTYNQTSTTDLSIIKNIFLIEIGYRFQSGKEIQKLDNKKSAKDNKGGGGLF